MSQWLQEGIANKEIARRLSRPVLTIRRELKRNKTRVAVGKDREILYEPVHAHAVAMQRKQNAWFAKQPLKNKNVYSYVLKHLRMGWSPEQISGRLACEDHPNDPSWQRGGKENCNLWIRYYYHFKIEMSPLYGSGLR